MSLLYRPILSKLITAIPKSSTFKNCFQLVAALRSINAELLIVSNTHMSPDDPDLDSANKPTLCIYNVVLIQLLESNNIVRWIISFKAKHPHILCSLGHHVDGCYS